MKTTITITYDDAIAGRLPAELDLRGVPGRTELLGALVAAHLDALKPSTEPIDLEEHRVRRDLAMSKNLP